MTETEWLACIEPQAMLAFLAGKASERKLRLFACGCGRRYCRYWHDIPDKPLIDRHCRAFIAAAERVIDDASFSSELETARSEIRRQSAQGIAWPLGLQWGLHAVSQGDWGWWVRQYESTARTAREEASMDEVELLKGYEERRFQCDLLRHLFGCLPFRPVFINRSWLTWNNGLIVSMARQMYDARNFSDLPILADALEDAGCTNPDMLSHCRSGQEHVRGCWVVDLLLGKG